MAQLRRDYSQLKKAGIEVIVIGPESADAFRDYWARENLPFIGLPDPKHIVLKRYGQEVKLFKLGRMPAQMLIDKSGDLRFVHYGSSMADIPATREILELLRE
ncbi:MAG: redoxin domain-containing protein [bacterium]